jgi:SpoVK/Ycf46/Vps4 family AAA+-type ATPase
MTQDSVEVQLKNIKRWHFIPGKNRITPVLESLISRDEYIIDIIDGFFPAEPGIKNSRDDSGLILVTDRTVILLRADSPDENTVLKKDKITSIACNKNFSSLSIIINSGKNHYTFVTHLTEFAVKNIFSAAGKTVQKENSPSGTSSDILSSPLTEETEDDGLTQSSASDLLYPEVKKINLRLGEFKSIITDENFYEMYKNDIYTISALCGMTGRELSDNEILFICMVISAAEKEQISDSCNFLEEVMKHDSFPHHLRDNMNIRMEIILSGIAKINSADEKYLKSIEYLINYDHEHSTKYADKMASLFYEYAQCLIRADGKTDGTEETKLKNISELIQREMHSTGITPEKAGDKSETIEQVMEKINTLVGMENIKEEIKSFINFVSIRTERVKRQLPVTPLSLHAVFYGPPGTGKTTIARLLGRVYKALGLLSSGHLVETDRAGLVAGYVGQTAMKTDDLVMKAKDGVLFIDEAYTLAPENSANDFGRESIDTILKRMEDMREGFAVIAAGYTDEMERFINSNPGLKSRFSRYFYFDHYAPEELIKIFNIFSDNVEFKLSSEAEIKLKDLITFFYNKRNRSFGNARFVRNVFDKIVQNQADRLAKITALTNELLCEITEEDIPLEEDFSAEQFV